MRLLSTRLPPLFPLLLVLGGAARTTASFVDPATLASAEPICEKNAARLAAAAQLDNPQDAAGKGQATPRGNPFPNLLAGQEVENDAWSTYIAGLITLAVPGCIWAVLNCCSCACCACCRGPCHVAFPHHCRACKCIPATRHYTKEERGMPVLAWLVFSFVMFLFATLGITNGVHRFNNSLVSGICLLDNAYVRFNQFLENVRIPLVNLKVDFNQASDNLEEASQIDPALTRNVQNLADSFGPLIQAAEDAKSAPTTNSQECRDYWQGIVDSCVEAQTTAEASARALDEQLRATQTSIHSSLVQQRSAATSALEDGKTALDDLKQQLDDSMNPATFGMFDMAEQIQSQKNNMAFSACKKIFPRSSASDLLFSTLTHLYIMYTWYTFPLPSPAPKPQNTHTTHTTHTQLIQHTHTHTHTHTHRRLDLHRHCHRLVRPHGYALLSHSRPPHRAAL